MKDRMLIADPVNSIIDLTKKIEDKEKFAFVNISRSALNAVAGLSEKKPPKHFIKALSKCVALKDTNFLKAVPLEFSSDIENGRFSNLGLERDGKYYDAGMFDYFYSNKKEVVDIFVNHYIRDSRNLVVTFHDKKTIQKVFGPLQDVISIPYNNYYDKLDAICAQVSEFDGGVDSVILDCPLLATALAPKIWEKSSMSIIDFGKIISFVRFNNSKSNEKK